MPDDHTLVGEAPRVQDEYSMKAFLGTNYGHDAAVALIGDNGRVLFAAEEGKLIGQKETASFPAAAITQACAQEDTEIMAWAEGWSVRRRLWSKGLMRTLRYGIKDRAYVHDALQREMVRWMRGEVAAWQWRQRLGRRHFVGHHLAHAWSLVPAGLSSDSLVLVSDTTGETESISVFVYTGHQMLKIAMSRFPHSLGGVFHQFAYHLGFDGRTGPGKLMALAGLGQPKFVEALDAIGVVEHGRFRINTDVFPSWRREGSWSRFAATQQAPLRIAIEQSKCAPHSATDLAASVQEWFVASTWKLLTQCQVVARQRLDVDIQGVGLAGGAALNCKANGDFNRALDQNGLPPLVLSPWPDDAGTAIGAAVWAYVSAGFPASSIKHAGPFLGPQAGASASKRQTTECDIKDAATALARGGLVGLASGRLEFGPRALGGRCILADPRQRNSVDKLNRVKGRPSFMPIAPAVKQHVQNEYFCEEGSPYMTWTVRARDRALRELPAAVHVDGTARIQVVDNEAPLLLQRLLEAFNRVAGCPALLLTSLNGSGEAVPYDSATALEQSRRLGLDGLLTDAGWFI